MLMDRSHASPQNNTAPQGDLVSDRSGPSNRLMTPIHIHLLDHRSMIQSNV